MYKVLSGNGIEWATQLPTLPRAQAAAMRAQQLNGLNVRIVDETGAVVETGKWTFARGGGMMNIPH